MAHTAGYLCKKIGTTPLPILLSLLFIPAAAFGQMKWTCATNSPAFAERGLHASIAFDNKMWVLHGMSASAKHSDIWYSTSGKDWTRATGSVPYPMRTLLCVVVFNESLWILCGGQSC